MGAERPTGATISGPCPGCDRMIVGMMPERCFICGHSFVDAIKAQNPSFEPTPGFKSPVGDIQPEVEADAWEKVGAAMNKRMDDQREIGNRRQEQITNLITTFVLDRRARRTDASEGDTVRKLNNFINETIPGIHIDAIEVSQDMQGNMEVSFRASDLRERIVDIEAKAMFTDAQLNRAEADADEELAKEAASEEEEGE